MGDLDGDFINIQKSVGLSISERLIRFGWILVLGLIASLVGEWGAGKIYSSYSIQNTGFHFPDREPTKSISEEHPPYYISIYKEGDRWRWVIYKHTWEGVLMGSGSTESYSLTKNIALMCVVEDYKR